MAEFANVDLHVDLLGKRLAGPVIAASGTFGFGPEYAGIEDLTLLGGISGKGLTLHGQPGNSGERLYETPSGLMNSIGLQNPGVDHFIEHELPAMKALGTTVWANLGGHTVEENVEGVEKLCAAGVDFLELNISCPTSSRAALRSVSAPRTPRAWWARCASLHRAAHRQAQPPGRKPARHVPRGRSRGRGRPESVQHLPGLRHRHRAPPPGV